MLRKVEANDELKQQFIEYKITYALLSLSDQVDNKEENQRGYIRFRSMVRTKKIHRFFMHTVGYAAAIVLLIVSTYWFTVNHYSTTPKIIADNTLYVPAGQRVKLTLQDGTDVWSNPQTTFT